MAGRPIPEENPQDIARKDEQWGHITSKDEVANAAKISTGDAPAGDVYGADDMPKTMRDVYDLYVRRANQYDIDPEEVERRRVRNRRRRFVAAIGDVGRAVTNLVGTHNWSPNGYDATKPSAAEADASNKEAEAMWKERRELADKNREKALGLHDTWQKQKRAEKAQALKELIADREYERKNLELEWKMLVQEGKDALAREKQAEIERHNRETEELRRQYNAIYSIKAYTTSSGGSGGKHHLLGHTYASEKDWLTAVNALADHFNMPKSRATGMMGKESDLKPADLAARVERKAVEEGYWDWETPADPSLILAGKAKPKKKKKLVFDKETGETKEVEE